MITALSFPVLMRQMKTHGPFLHELLPYPIKAAALREGPLFRLVDRHGNPRPERLNNSDIAVSDKGSVEVADFDPPDYYNSDSLRAGLASAVAALGTPTNTLR